MSEIGRTSSSEPESGQTGSSEAVSKRSRLSRRLRTAVSGLTALLAVGVLAASHGSSTKPEASSSCSDSPGVGLGPKPVVFKGKFRTAGGPAEGAEIVERGRSVCISIADGTEIRFTLPAGAGEGHPNPHCLDAKSALDMSAAMEASGHGVEVLSPEEMGTRICGMGGVVLAGVTGMPEINP